MNLIDFHNIQPINCTTDINFRSVFPHPLFYRVCYVLVYGQVMCPSINFKVSEVLRKVSTSDVNSAQILF